MSDLCSKQSSRKLYVRARREYRQMKRLQRLMHSRIDKNPAFYLGSATTMAAKAQEYMTTTAAYREIRDGRCPLADHLAAVRTLLDYLVSRKAITPKQKVALLPNVDKLELAHFHGLPKVHKVGFLLIRQRFHSLSCSPIAQHAIATYRCWNECTHDTYFQVLERSSCAHLLTSGSCDDVH